MRLLMLAVGVLATLLGLLWIGQGLGWVHFPANGMMVGNTHWVYIGAIVVIIGIGLVGYSRRYE
jgi:hypothetical protein